MADEVILDTNIASLLALSDPSIQQRVSQLRQAYLPTIVLGELLFGAYRIASTGKGQRLITLYDAFALRFPILDVDTATAREYAHIRAELEASGQRIPVNNLWIAAFARRYNLPIATRDIHFTRVTGISIDPW